MCQYLNTLPLFIDARRWRWRRQLVGQSVCLYASYSRSSCLTPPLLFICSPVIAKTSRRLARRANASTGETLVPQRALVLRLEIHNIISTVSLRALCCLHLSPRIFLTPKAVSTQAQTRRTHARAPAKPSLTSISLGTVAGRGG